MSDSDFFEKVFTNMPCGAALQEIICDSAGAAVDYMTLEVNPLFGALLGIDPADVIGSRASEHLPSEELRHWLGIFGPVALEERATRYVMHSPLHHKTFQGIALCPRKGYCFIMFTEGIRNSTVLPKID
jgi:PAS domain-containing protein